jgi:hypothetical protein
VVVVSREEAKLLQYILRRQASRDLIHTEVLKATLFLQEAVWKDQVIHQVLPIEVLQRAVADRRTAADHHQVPTPQDHLPDLTHPDHPLGLHPDLHRAEAVEAEVLQEEDNLKQ